MTSCRKREGHTYQARSRGQGQRNQEEERLLHYVRQGHHRVQLLLGNIGTICTHELPDCRKCNFSELGSRKTTGAVREISGGQWERRITNLYNEMQNLGKVIGLDHLKPNTDSFIDSITKFIQAKGFQNYEFEK